MYYYEVAPTKIIRAKSDTFTYHSKVRLAVGAFVQIPVGSSAHIGLVIHQSSKPAYPTKEVCELLAIPPLPAALVTTALWMATYYHTPLATVLQAILPRGITKKRRVRERILPEVQRDRTNYLLNKDQAAALESLASIRKGTVLLHGVTGSGKTAVYIEYAKQCIARDTSVIILVPEIALTSQLVAEFRHHLSNIVLAHSKQTESERHHHWQTVLDSTEPQVIIGPRSALFLPARSIGAIIIDEAHEPSFKQEQSPKYSALRVAAILAKHHGGIVIQGSATPSVTEYYVAEQRKQPIISLPRRARQATQDPVVTLVDMTKKNNFHAHRFLSDELLKSISATLEARKQVLIFHNRRGSASTTLCESCGWSAMCSRCFVPYTLHADTHELRCHICNNAEGVPTSCPLCRSTDIIHKGIGTKLIETELSRLFPSSRIARFDGDAHDSLTIERQYQALYDGAIDIIIGTQVVAKGLDLPHLRTVGVIQADAGLSLPDFTAPERTFQLLSQVVGRVGRSDHKTSVVIQSYQPEAPAVRYGLAQDYKSFYDETISLRKSAHFPPFTYLLKLTCTYKQEATAIHNARTLAALLRKDFADITILGPTPSFYERQHDTYRWQITVKSTDRNRLLSIIDVLPPAHWQYDIDPSSLL